LKKRMLYFLLALFTFIVVSGCDEIKMLFEEDVSDEAVDAGVESVDDLERTEYFRDGALIHILEGELNRNNQAVGFHYEGMPGAKGETIDDTETDPNEYGVYEAEVKVSDVEKTSNNGKSSFFPKDWTAQEVVDGINEAYEAKELLTGNTYEGLTDEGVVIQMYIDNEGEIISAFPVY